MSNEAIDLVVLDTIDKSPQFLDNLTPEYRTELFKLKVSKIDFSGMNKTQEIATIYNLEKAFKIPFKMIVIQNILGVKRTTVDRRMKMARDAGLVKFRGIKELTSLPI